MNSGRKKRADATIGTIPVHEDHLHKSTRKFLELMEEATVHESFKLLWAISV